MKKSLLLLSVFSGCAIWAAAPVASAPAQPAPAVQSAPAAAPVAVAQPAPAAPAVPAAPAEEEPGIAFCLARGFANIITGFLELPRCIIYDNGAVPVFGVLAGIPEGAFLMIGREFCGIYDLLSLGNSGSTCHGKVFPDFVFQSKWIYRSK